MAEYLAGKHGKPAIEISRETPFGSSSSGSGQAHVVAGKAAAARRIGVT